MRTVRVGVKAVVWLVLAAAPVIVFAQAGHETALAAYRRAVIALQSHHGSVEQVFNRGLVVRLALLQPDSRGVTTLESLSSTDFDALKRQFEGFLLNRDEAVFVNPNPAFFSDLAREYGDDGDQSFFTAYTRTRPQGIWPVWVEQQTDEAGCTKFGAGHLVSSYRLWTDFRRTHPHRYKSEVEGFLGAVEYEVSESTCACGEPATVLRELEEFERAFPQSRVDNAVKRRIREIHENRSPIRFGCTAG